MSQDPIRELTQRLRRFASERDWDQFHSPKNLAMALTVEAAELMEHFQWLDGERSRELSPAKRTQVEHEIADVFIYLIELADSLGVDLAAAARRKIEINAAKYPVEKARGNALKYTEL